MWFKSRLTLIHPKEKVGKKKAFLLNVNRIVQEFFKKL